MSSIKKGLRRAGVGGLSAILATTAMTGFASMASANSTFSFDRVAGLGRYQTSVATAVKFGASDNVILASGEKGHFPDALAASYLAGLKKAPIMLTTLASTPTVIAAQIKASGAKNVWIIGGTGVVSAAQEATLATSYTVTRLGGLDRYITAEKVVEAGGVATSTTAVLATGQDFPDALGGGALSYVAGMPLAITKTNTLPAETLAALKAAGTKNVIILGGTAVVGQGVVDALATNGITVLKRLAGADRAETSSLLADYEITNAGFSTTAVNAASGYSPLDGVDALGGAALSGKDKTPLLITRGVAAAGAGVLAFLTAHAPTLASGHIFGGTGAINAATEAAMQAAARGVVANQTFTVISATGSTFTYADPALGKTVVQTFKSTDVFTVDGVTASLGVFTAALAFGDSIEILANTPTTGVTTYNLVTKVAADFTSGLVGKVDTSTTAFTIIEPVTGDVLNTVDYVTGGNTFLTVNGSSVTAASFSGSINEGDTVAITGKDTIASPRTIALTNATVTGTASGIAHSATVPSFFVDTAAGASLGDNPAVGADVAGYVVSSADTFTVDGVTATVSAFDTALTAGDTVNYARAGGIQTVALVNHAAAPVNGVVAKGSALATMKYVVGSSSSVTSDPTSYATGYSLILDGSLATATEMNAAMTAGDTVKIQAGDTGTSTTATVTLTDKSLSGVIDSPNASTTLNVLSADGAPLYTSLNYVTGFTFYAGNTSATYFVGGVSKTLAQFNSELSLVKNGSKTGTIQVVDNGAVTEFRITTATNTAAATLVTVANPGTAAVTTLTLTFDKPIYLADTAAGTDFTFTGTGVNGAVTYTDATPNVVGSASNTVTLAISSHSFVAGVVKVTLTTSGAAKFLEANGTAAATSFASVTVS